MNLKFYFWMNQRMYYLFSIINMVQYQLFDSGDLDTKNTVEIMDLLLRINLNKKTTCVMVTHNPDVETYADRILFVSDGRFNEQALNEIQVPLIFENYSNFLKSK